MSWDCIIVRNAYYYGVKKGKCNRCGACCYIWDDPLDSNCKKRRCEHLSFNRKRQAKCNNYNNRPDMCKRYPIAPVPENTKCGFYWVKK